MCYEDLMVVFCLFSLAIERLKEGRNSVYGVVGPLLIVLAEERGVGTYGFCALLMGGQRYFLHEGKPVFAGGEWFAWDFDATRGFPGEDTNLL